MKNIFKHIPNNKKGKAFISQLREYIDRDIVKVVKLRGRGSRKNATGYMKDLTNDQAERFAVYFDYVDEKDYQNKFYRLENELKTIKQTLKFIFKKTDLVKIIDQIDQEVENLEYLSFKYNELVNTKSDIYTIKRGLSKLVEIKGEPNDK
tara:strand:- start:251 stop:700 length:450 start_codon:yes stop_codon:yes gene_type:complete